MKLFRPSTDCISMLFYSPAPCSAGVASSFEASPMTDLDLRNLPESRGLVRPSATICLIGGYVFQSDCSLFYLVPDIVIRRINVLSPR